MSKLINGACVRGIRMGVINSKRFGSRKGSVSFTLETVMTILLVLIVGAVMFYFLFIYIYRDNMVGLFNTFKSGLDSAFAGG